MDLTEKCLNYHELLHVALRSVLSPVFSPLTNGFKQGKSRPNHTPRLSYFVWDVPVSLRHLKKPWFLVGGCLCKLRRCGLAEGSMSLGVSSEVSENSLLPFRALSCCSSTVPACLPSHCLCPSGTTAHAALVLLFYHNRKVAKTRDNMRTIW